MSGWVVEYTHEAVSDIKRLDHTQQVVVVKATVSPAISVDI